MKNLMKHLVVCFFILLGSFPIYGQYSLNDFILGKTKKTCNYDFGVIFGGGISSAHEPELNRGDWDPRFSFSTGLMARYRILDYLSIEGDIVYNTNKATDYGDIQLSPYNSWSGSTTLTASTLQIPLSLILTTSQKTHTLVVLSSGGGLFSAVPLSAKKVIEFDPGPYRLNNTSSNVKNDYPAILYGYNAIIGVKAMDASVELRYCRDLNGYGTDNEGIVDVNAWNI